MGQLCGMSAYFMRYFDPVKVLQVIEEQHTTVFVGVPVMYKSFFEVGFEDYDLSSMRFWASSTDAMPQEYIDRVRRQGAAWRLGPLKTGPIFAEAYGMVELSAIATMKLYLPGLRWPPGCVGYPIFPIRTKVVGESGWKLPADKVGELLVTGPGVMKGYWNDPRETARVMDGKWLHTGDMACKDRWGRIYYVDRKKDVIKCGGTRYFRWRWSRRSSTIPPYGRRWWWGCPIPPRVRPRWQSSACGKTWLRARRSRRTSS